MNKNITPYLLYEEKETWGDEAHIIIAFPDLPANLWRINCAILECTENGQCFQSHEEIDVNYIRKSCRKISPPVYKKWKGFIDGYLSDMNRQNEGTLQFKRMVRLPWNTLRKSWVR